MPPANPPPAPSPEDVQAAESLLYRPCPRCAEQGRYVACEVCAGSGKVAPMLGVDAVAIALRDARAAAFRAGLSLAYDAARNSGLSPNDKAVLAIARLDAEAGR